MTISLEDVVGLLSKWNSESTPLKGVLLSDAGVLFGGVITDLNPDAFVVSQYLSSGQKTFEVAVGLQIVERFEYQDLRETPPNTRKKLEGGLLSVLTMKLPASTLCLYETERQASEL